MKTLPIIKTEKGYVAVSDEKIKEKDWMCIISDCGIIQINKVSRIKGIADSPTYETVYPHLGLVGGKNDFKKIIATDTSFKLNDVPQFELRTEDPNTKILNQWVGNLSRMRMNPDDIDKITELHSFHYIEGYKAAQSKGCYTEEQVRNFIDSVLEFVSHNEPDEFNEWYEKKWNKLKSIIGQPKELIAIEVECILRRNDGCPFTIQKNGLYQAHDEHGWETLDIKDGILELVLNKSNEYSDGLLIVKKYIYP